MDASHSLENSLEDITVVKAVKGSKKKKEVVVSKGEAKSSSKSVLKKLDGETIKILSQLKEKVNKKDFGRKVRDSELIQLGLGLIDSDHIRNLQESTYTERDRLSLAHLEFQKTHGKISLDQFIGKLLNGEISNKA